MSNPQLCAPCGAGVPCHLHDRPAATPSRSSVITPMKPAREWQEAVDDLLDEGFHEAALLPRGACTSCLGSGDCPRCADAVVLLGPCAACAGDGACSVCAGTGQSGEGPGDTRA